MIVLFGGWVGARDRETWELGRILGDLNCDCAFDGADIDPFFVALVDPALYGVLFPDCDLMRADMNADGTVDGADIDAFFECLVAGCP